jgi:hypothetical protein
MAMAVGAVGIVLLIAGLVGPWWTLSLQASALGSTITSSQEFRPSGYTTTVQGPGVSTSNQTDYAGDPNMGGVFTTGFLLSAVAILCGVAMIGLTAMSGPRPSFHRLGAILGILAFVLALVAALYVMSALPAAATTDAGAGGPTISGFWGSQTTSVFGVSTVITWGAGWAWYLVLVAALVFLVGGVLSLRAPKAGPAAPAAESPPAMPPPSP